MAEIKRAAQYEQPDTNSVGSIITHNSLKSLKQVASMFAGEVTFIKLKGYSNANKETNAKKRYSTAKMPIDKNWTSPDFTGHSITDLCVWIDSGGWVGLRIPDGFIVVDVDDAGEGVLIEGLLEQHKVQHHLMKTPNGYQFILQDTGMVKRQNAKMFTECGFAVDYRLAGKGQIVIPTPNTEGREWLHTESAELSDMPYWFEPLKQISVNSPRPFDVPIAEGSRNTVLYQHACRIKKFGRSEEQIYRTIGFINTYLCSPSLEQREIETAINSAMKYNDEILQPGHAAPVQANYAAPEPALYYDGQPNFNRTDLGNAQRLIYRHGQDLRFCDKFGAWYVWDEKRWNYDETQEIVRRAKDTARSILDEARNADDDALRASLAGHAIKSESASKIMSMIRLAQSEPGIPVTPAQLDGDLWTLNCQNGVVDLKMGKLMPHSRERLITKSITIDYDPKAECPNWTRFLEQVMKDEDGKPDLELINFLQKSIGYSLTGDISEQVLFFLYGSGRNGKSTFINVIKELLGDYAMQAPTETFMLKQNAGGNSNDLARLKGARLISTVESEEGKRLAESLIKQLTGGEPITARFLHQEFFEFLPSFKIFFVTNHKPVIKNSDLGIWRRIRLIPFTVTIPPEEVDKKLPEKLREEMPGILRWAVEGCLKWQSEGLTPPNRVVEATDEYRSEMDTLSHFVNDYCVVNPAARVATKDLYEAYKEWSEENGEYVLAKNKFIQRLRERMESHGHAFKAFQTSKMRGWTGLGLQSDPDLINMVSDTGDTKNDKVKHISDYKENAKSSATSVTRAETAATVKIEEGEI
jgi:putative DNA primase/helicase